MKPDFSPIDIQKLRELFLTPKRTVILGHVSPDGDALGSTLALSGVLKHKGCDTTVIYPTAFGSSFNILAGAEETIIAKHQPEIAEAAIRKAEVIICMDFNEPKRLENIADSVIQSGATKVMIDHHLHPADYTDLTFSYPQISSTSLLLFHLLRELRWDNVITKEIAECIFVGMMTDTGNFSYNSEDPHIYTTISTLLEYGIEKDRITSDITRSYTIDKIRLNAHLLDKNLTFYPALKTAVITVTGREKNDYNYQVGDIEGLVNEPLAAKDIEFSILLHEMSKYTKISLRSKGDFPCNEFAKRFFNGGGHKNASGAEVFDNLKSTLELVKMAIQVMHP